VGNYLGGEGFGSQGNTGFNATGGYLDLAYRPLSNQTVRLSGIYNSRDDIGYYASSKINRSGIPRTVQPYERRGIYRFDYEINNLGFLSDSLKAYAYYQHYGQKRETNTETTTTLTNKDVTQDQDIFGGGLQNTMAIREHSLTFGADYRSEDLSSTPTQNLLTKATGIVASTIPTGNTPNGSYDVLDAFAIAQLKLLRDLTVTVGDRVEQTHLQARPKASDVIPNAGYTLQDLQVDKTWFATTWSIGAIYRVVPSFDLSANVASGFRAPSFSDVLSTGTPVFSTKVASIPSPGLGPEKAISYEVGPRFHNDQWQVNLSAYWTHLYDYIRSNSGGTVTIAGVDYVAQTNSNSGEGYIRGLELALSFKPGDFSFFGNVNYTEGEDTKFHEYLRFIPPLYGTVGVRYDAPSKRWWGEATEVLVNRLLHHAPKDEQDSSFASDPGLGSPGTTNPPLRSNFQIPGYALTNLRAGWTAWKSAKRSLDLTLDLNNIFDKAYREAYSQQELVAPGFNCVIGAKVTF
jgi:hemoglobin/transferrin/lactoferrin receptor protein